MNEGGSRNGAFLSLKRLSAEAPLLGTLKDMLRKAPDTGISLHRGPIGEPGGDSLAGTFERKR